jgi:hypothetical protein
LNRNRSKASSGFCQNRIPKCLNGCDVWIRARAGHARGTGAGPEDVVP